MATIICNETKGYKLTRGKEYDLIKRANGYVYIVNDAGTSVKYDASLFGESIPARRNTRPVAPPPPPRRTERDVIASITVNDQAIDFIDIDNRPRRFINSFVHAGTNISCGIYQTSGINTTISRIDECFNLNDDDFINVRKALFKKAINSWVIEAITGRAMTTLSTNIDDEDMLSVLDELVTENGGVMSAVRRNPNSGNNIKLWVLYVNDED